jgi:Branched-chain amino acid ABC-type transport system, permease components
MFLPCRAAHTFVAKCKNKQQEQTTQKASFSLRRKHQGIQRKNMLGGLLLGVIEALAAGYISIAWKDAIAFFVLILILIIRPTGILGERTADKL